MDPEGDPESLGLQVVHHLLGVLELALSGELGVAVTAFPVVVNLKLGIL